MPSWWRMVTKIYVHIGPVNGLVQYLKQCWLITSVSVKMTWMPFCKWYLSHHSRKLVWKLFMWDFIQISHPANELINSKITSWKESRIFKLLKYSKCSLHFLHWLPIYFACLLDKITMETTWIDIKQDSKGPWIYIDGDINPWISVAREGFETK